MTTQNPVTPATPAPRPTDPITRSFFFETNGAPTRLHAVLRLPDSQPSRIWLIFPPFAEEEKSARRTLAEIADALRARGEAALIFSYRGTGDSEGEFAEATLQAWRDDIAAAAAQARRAAPDAELALAGVRLGASLALQIATEVGASRLVLIEPILRGKTLMAALNQKRRLRAMITKSEEADARPSPPGLRPPPSPNNGRGQAASTPLPSRDAQRHGDKTPISLREERGRNDETPLPLREGRGEGRLSAPSPYDLTDFDGWPISAALQAELAALDIASPPAFSGSSLVLQVGPRDAPLPANEAFAIVLGARLRALKMQPFWNLIDYSPAEAVFETLREW